ncbi:hypothetical protein C8Q80DRAFT_342736 [Daedaleopsis nitida]|nr:hypothetical protein C8Q80DRAFT_342736 [Daedaleopsis nitida]
MSPSPSSSLRWRNTCPEDISNPQFSSFSAVTSGSDSSRTPFKAHSASPSSVLSWKDTSTFTSSTPWEDCLPVHDAQAPESTHGRSTALAEDGTPAVLSSLPQHINSHLLLTPSTPPPRSPHPVSTQLSLKRKRSNLENLPPRPPPYTPPPMPSAFPTVSSSASPCCMAIHRSVPRPRHCRFPPSPDTCSLPHLSTFHRRKRALMGIRGRQAHRSGDMYESMTS